MRESFIKDRKPITLNEKLTLRVSMMICDHRFKDKEVISCDACLYDAEIVVNEVSDALVTELTQR